MGEPWCEHCELPLSHCPHGNASARAAEAEVLEATPGVRVASSLRATDLVQDGPTIEATQRSPCVGCGETIIEGESITHTSEGWVHTEEVTLQDKAPKTDTSIFDGID